MNSNPALTLVIAWFAAAALTWIITATSLLAWFRLVHKARYEQRANQLLNNTINQLPPDDPRRWRLLQRYEILVAYGEFPGCRKCVGFWMYVLTALAAWLSLGGPGTLWGIPSWFAMPALVLGSWWIFVILAQWLEPPSPSPATVVRT
jgi:hypothetical protein